MAGQSATLSLKEARAMQERVQLGTNHSSHHGHTGSGGHGVGSGGSNHSGGDSTHKKMKKEEGC